MTKEQRKEIVKISKSFANGFKGTFDSINNTGWLIVDPLGGYLNVCGFENTLHKIPNPNPGNHPEILIIKFKDGDQLIPAGGDMKGSLFPKAKNWFWVE